MTQMTQMTMTLILWHTITISYNIRDCNKKRNDIGNDEKRIYFFFFFIYIYMSFLGTSRRTCSFLFSIYLCGIWPVLSPCFLSCWIGLWWWGLIRREGGRGREGEREKLASLCGTNERTNEWNWITESDSDSTLGDFWIKWEWERKYLFFFFFSFIYIWIARNIRQRRRGGGEVVFPLFLLLLLSLVYSWLTFGFFSSFLSFRGRIDGIVGMNDLMMMFDFMLSFACVFLFFFFLYIYVLFFFLIWNPVFFYITAFLDYYVLFMLLLFSVFVFLSFLFSPLPWVSWIFDIDIGWLTHAYPFGSALGTVSGDWKYSEEGKEKKIHEMNYEGWRVIYINIYLLLLYLFFLLSFFSFLLLARFFGQGRWLRLSPPVETPEQEQRMAGETCSKWPWELIGCEWALLFFLFFCLPPPLLSRSMDTDLPAIAVLRCATLLQCIEIGRSYHTLRISLAHADRRNWPWGCTYIRRMITRWWWWWLSSYWLALALRRS